MSSTTRRLLSTLFAIAAAVCLALALFSATPKIASAAEGDSGVALTDADLVITEGVVEGFNDSGKEKIEANAALTLTIETATSIADEAFYNQNKLTAITIGEGVEEIGANAFALQTISYIDALKEITIPQSVTSIDSLAFANRANLNTINFYATDCVVAPDTALADAAKNNPFYQAGIAGGKDGLTVNIGEADAAEAVNIPDFLFVAPSSAYKNKITAVNLANVASIGEYAFYNCENIKTLTAEGNSLTSIGEYAFYNCKALDVITLPKSVEVIGKYAFNNCSSLTQIGIPAGVETLGESAFRNCTSLKDVTLPNGLTSIGSYAFYQCRALESFTVPDSVETIGESAFAGDTLLKAVSVNAKGNLTSIGKNSFNGCTSLETIVIPEGVTEIGNSAYTGCTAVTNIKYYAKNANDFPSTASTHPFGSVGSQGTGIEVEINGVTKIPANMFYYGGNLNVTNVAFINVSAAIGENSFANCSNLTTVTFNGGTVTQIGGYAFQNCQSLTHLVIPEGIETIGTYAFWNCKSLITVTLPSTLTDIGVKAFGGCERLIEVTDLRSGSSLTAGSTDDGEVAKYAVSVVKNGGQPTLKVKDGLYFISKNNKYYLIGADSALTDIELPRYVPDTVNTRYEIDAKAFSGLNNLISVKIPTTVTRIGDYAFYQCKGLTSVVIENGLTEIGMSAFSGCSSLTNVTLPNTIKEIPSELFKGCTSLRVINIPDTVTAIGSYAFMNTSLESLVIPVNVTTIGLEAFESCKNLSSLEFACTSLKSVGAYAFRDCTALNVVKIPATVTSLGDEAFNGASSLKTVYLPKRAQYGKDVFTGCSNDLLIISPDESSYDSDKFYLGTLALTYIIEVKLVYGEYTEQNPDVIEKLYGFDFSYELQSDGSWGNTGTETPVQKGYVQSVWYADKNYQNQLSASEINAMLRSEDTVLYAKYVGNPDLTAVNSPGYEYFYQYESGLAISNENLSEMLEILFGYDETQLTDDVINEFNDKYVFELTGYEPFAGNGKLSGYVKNAGKYTISVTLNPAYGEWEQAYLINFTVERWIVDLSNTDELNWVIMTDSGRQGLNSEKIWIPVSGSGAPYIAEEGKNPPEGYVEKYVEKSVTRYNGNQWQLVIVGSSINKYSVTYGNTKGSDIGIYTATARVTPTNNFVLGTGAGVTDYGITCKPQADGSYIVEKVWYIVAMSNELWAGSDSNEKFDVKGWTYNEPDIDSKIPSAPKLTYGNGKEALLITFSLSLETESEEVELVKNESYEYFSKWINKAMPAGEYTLTIFVASTQSGNDAVATMEEQFVFTVAKAKFDDAVTSVFTAAINDALSGKKLKYISTGEVEVGYGLVKPVIESLSVAALNPNRDLGTRSVWGDEEYDKYYSGPEISYNISTMPFDDYFTMTELGSSQYAPRSAGAYTVYYQLSALNYDELADNTDRRDYKFSLVIYEEISTSDVLTDMLYYTGSPLVPAVSNDKYQVILLNAVGNITDDAVLSKNFTEEDINYTDTGVHKVVVKILNSDIYSWQVDDFSTGIEVFGDNDEYAIIEFMIMRAYNETTRALDIIRWSWGSYDYTVNVPIWTTKFGSAKDYTFTLVSLSNSKTYTQDKFGTAPAGSYTLRATAAGGDGYNWETYTATATVNILKADNYWDVTPTVYGWLYGEYATRISSPTAIPHFGSASAVSISYYTLNANGEINSQEYNSLDKLKNDEGEVPVGSYLMVVQVPGSDNYNAMPVTNVPFIVSKTYNSWIDVPFIIGWSENHFDEAENKLNEGKAQFGEVTIVITDSKNNVIELSDLASLEVGNYTLTAYVAGTDDYYEMQPITTTFAVVEDSVGMTGIIAATIVFAVIAVGLAVAAILLLIRRNKLVEEEFRKMVRTELGRK